MRVWLLEGRADAEPGFQAWALDHLGFATWAPTRTEVLEKLPAKLDEFRGWVTSRDLGDPGPDPGVAVVEEIVGDEVLFTPDHSPATIDEIGRTIALLHASREDLVGELESIPAGALDWEPPYRAFLPWARWRTIRQIVTHVANTETHYYLDAIGCRPPFDPVGTDAAPESYLSLGRAHTLSTLESLASSSDLARIRDGWSVRKVLRRLIWHERLHTKSIHRIQDAYTPRKDS